MEETWSTKQKTEFFPNERQLAFGADQGERRGLLFTAACFEYECKGPRESDSQHEYSGGDEWSGGGPVDWWRRVLGSDAGMWPLAKNWNWKIINCRPAMRREQQSEFRAEIQSNARPVFLGVSVVMAFISAGCSGRALEVTRRSSETRNLFLGPLDGARKIWEVIHSSERRMATIAGLDSLFVCLWCGDLGAGSADSDSESDSSSGLFWLHNCRKREPK